MCQRWWSHGPFPSSSRGGGGCAAGRLCLGCWGWQWRWAQRSGEQVTLPAYYRSWQGKEISLGWTQDNPGRVSSSAPIQAAQEIWSEVVGLKIVDQSGFWAKISSSEIRCSSVSKCNEPASRFTILWVSLSIFVAFPEFCSFFFLFFAHLFLTYFQLVISALQINRTK